MRGTPGPAPIRACVITVSDGVSGGQREDESGEVARQLLKERLGAEIVASAVVPDDAARIGSELKSACDGLRCDLVVTTGGTGMAPRDVTPEATRSVLEKEAPGLAEAMRLSNLNRTRSSMLSRGVSGIRGRSLIVNLPGSPRGVRESLEAVLDQIPHAIALLRGEAGLH